MIGFEGSFIEIILSCGTAERKPVFYRPNASVDLRTKR